MILGVYLTRFVFKTDVEVVVLEVILSERQRRAGGCKW